MADDKPTLDFTELDAKLVGEKGDAPAEDFAGWIANGSKNWTGTGPEAEGKRFAHCTHRLEAIAKLRDFEAGGLDHEIKWQEEQLAHLKDRRDQLDRWEADRGAWYRQAIHAFVAETKLFEDADARTVGLPTGELALRKVAESRRIEYHDGAEAVLFGLLPADCFKVHVAEANKRLVASDAGQVRVKETGEVLAAEVVTVAVKPAREALTLKLEGRKISLDRDTIERVKSEPVTNDLDDADDFFGDEAHAETLEEEDFDE